MNGGEDKEAIQSSRKQLGFYGTPQEFEENVARPLTSTSKIPTTGLLSQIAHCLCDMLGWNMESGTNKVYCSTTDKPMTLDGITVPTGNVIGYNEKINIRSSEGFFVDITFGAKVFEKGETDIHEWTFHGDSDTKINLVGNSCADITCNCMTNRILDVIRAPSGLCTVNMLGPVRYVHKLKDHTEGPPSPGYWCSQ